MNFKYDILNIILLILKIIYFNGFKKEFFSFYKLLIVLYSFECIYVYINKMNIILYK